MLHILDVPLYTQGKVAKDWMKKQWPLQCQNLLKWKIFILAVAGLGDHEMDFKNVSSPDAQLYMHPKLQ